MLGEVSTGPGAVYNTYLYLAIIFTVLSAAGIFVGVHRSKKRSGVREDRNDRSADIVLGDDKANPPKPGLIARLDTQDRKTADLQRDVSEIKEMITPNGGDSKQLGDLVQNLDKKMDTQGEKLDRHLGESAAIHRIMWHAIDQRGHARDDDKE